MASGEIDGFAREAARVAPTRTNTRFTVHLTSSDLHSPNHSSLPHHHVLSLSEILLKDMVSTTRGLLYRPFQALSFLPHPL